MKVSYRMLLLAAALVLAACNFTLAEDIPPPPGYVPPTPMPTLGPLFPAQAPDVSNGAAIFAQRCVPCHGSTGLGDGPQSMQLPVAVPAIGLPEGARDAAPAAWFTTVSQGNLDRFMPPFSGTLTEQERWDVVAYVLTLHTSPAVLERGKSLIEGDCPECAAAFSSAERMSALSEEDIVRMIRSGEQGIPAVAKDYSDEDAFAAAAYLRTLAFGGPAPVTAQITALPATNAVAATPETEGTPVAAAVPAAGMGVVHGIVEANGPTRAEGLTVTLRGYDHGADQTSGPQEVLTLAAKVAADGSYVFENVGMPLNRIFLADVEYAGITYQSGFVAAAADSSSLELPLLKVYEPSEDPHLLSMQQLHIYTDFGTPGTVQVLEVFAFSNSSDRAVIISTDGITIPFIPAPAGATNQGYEAGQDSAQFVAANDGLAVVPSDQPYSIITFFNLPYDREMDFRQLLTIDTPAALLLVPEGIKVAGDQFQAEGPQVIQNNNYMEYSAANLQGGTDMSFAASGKPRRSSAAGITGQQGWLIGGGLLGLALILGGIFLFVRDRRTQVASPDETGFRNTEEVLDAVLALDDLHRAGKITDSAHAARRNELKEILRQLS